MQFVPAAIRQRAEKYRLGRLQGVYLFRKQFPLGYFLGPLSIVIGCLIFAFFAMYYENWFSWVPRLPRLAGLAGLGDWQVVLVLLVGVAWLLVGVWMLVAARIVRNMGVFVYEHGLIYLRVQTVVVPWQRVEGLWKDVRVVGRRGKQETRRTYIVQCVDDTLVRFDDEITDIEKLGSLLEDAITRRLLPRAIATYEAGATVVFAELAVNARGVMVKQARQMLPWQDVAGVTIDDTTVALYHFHKNGTWATLPVAVLPNVGVLKALLEYAMRDLSHVRLPGLLATYRAGLALDFGALRVSLRGIDVPQGNVFLPWDEVASIAVGEHEVMMRLLGLQPSWYTVPVSMVYDAALLKELLEYLMRDRSA